MSKTGTGTLVIAGVNTLFGAVNVTEGTLLATSSSALGFAASLGPAVSDGATLALQGGIGSSRQ